MRHEYFLKFFAKVGPDQPEPSNPLAVEEARTPLIRRHKWQVVRPRSVASRRWILTGSVKSQAKAARAFRQRSVPFPRIANSLRKPAARAVRPRAIPAAIRNNLFLIRI